MIDLPPEVKAAVVYSAQNWPKVLDAKRLLSELDIMAKRIVSLYDSGVVQPRSGPERTTTKP